MTDIADPADSPGSVKILSREEVERHKAWAKKHKDLFQLNLIATIEAHDKGRRLALKAIKATVQCIEKPDASHGRLVLAQVNAMARALNHAEQLRKDGWPDD